MKKTLLALALVAGTGLVAEARAEEPINLSLSGASPGGLWSVVAAGLSSALDAGIPGSSITYQTGSGGLANTAMVAAGRAELGLAGDMELNAAVKGEGEFAGRPLGGLTVILRGYDGAKTRYQMFQPIINAGYAEANGVETFDDIIDQKLPLRVGVNRVGNMDSTIALDLMAEMGLDAEKVQEFGGDVIHASSSELATLMQDRRIDLVFAGYSFNHSSVREMASAIDLRMLPVSTEAAEAVAEQHAAEICSADAGEYDWMNIDLTTVCVGVVIVAQESFDEETAYRMTKAIVENIEKLKATHPALAKVTPEMIAQPSAAPFHPGSERYFREAGLLD